MAITTSEIESMTGRDLNANDQKIASPVQRKRKGRKRRHNKHYHWLESHPSAVMVVAALIATLACRLLVNPPGGFWKDTKENTKNPHTAGCSIMADNHPEAYLIFLAVNTLVFLASLSIVMFHVSGILLRRRLSMWILMATFTFMALTFGLSMTIFMSPYK